jgi:hypothetical protein
MAGSRPSTAALREARDVLGVTAEANPGQIACACRRQARRLHPDVSGEPDATERFWALEAAYHVVLDAVLDAPLDAPSTRASVVTVPPTVVGDAPGRVAPRGTPATRQAEHRDPTVVLDKPLDVPTYFHDDHQHVPWLVAGPVRVEAPGHPATHQAHSSPGDR